MGKVHVIRGETGGKSYNQGVKSLKIDQYSVTSNYLSITGKIPYLFLPPPLEVEGGGGGRMRPEYIPLGICSQK